MCRIFRRKKTVTQESLKECRDLFFKFVGSIFGMMQEGVYPKYKKLHIPKDEEERWRNTLFDDTIETFKAETNICEKVFLISRLIDFGIREDAVFSVLIDFLNQNIDTFTIIILFENLKRFLKYTKKDVIYAQANTIIRNKKNEMLRSAITVDEEYKKNSYMLSYDFSDENLKVRINNL